MIYGILHITVLIGGLGQKISNIERKMHFPKICI